ncbi:MAG TPA: hypothetical protein VE152_04115, partial [Acidimicrobiales bacterium]|nr:hypothetical protein [Acidimicrobiales bacterium]
MLEGARPANDDDLPIVVELWQEAQADVGRMRGGQLLIQRELPAGPAAEHLAAALSDPAATVVVGTLSDHVVGYGL